MLSLKNIVVGAGMKDNGAGLNRSERGAAGDRINHSSMAAGLAESTTTSRPFRSGCGRLKRRSLL